MYIVQFEYQIVLLIQFVSKMITFVLILIIMFDQHPYIKLIDTYISTQKLPASPAHLYDPIGYILSLSGKRIRPLLVLLSADMFGNKDNREALPASLAIEYFHNFSLIHDDIMDKAPMRRGKQSVHQKWNDNVAILSGDALLVKAYEELGKCPAIKVPALLTVFNRIAAQVCEGQQLDMDFETQNDVSEQDYIEMIKLKTSVLLGGALQLGAILANASQLQQTLIYEFGVNLGIAFQLQDDYLDVYGNPETFGKQVGGDILSNKKTILWIRTQQLATGENKIEFNTLLQDDTIPNIDKVNRMKNLYASLAVDQFAKEVKLQYMSLAFSKLEAIDLPEGSKADLLSLAQSLMNRAK